VGAAVVERIGQGFEQPQPGDVTPRDDQYPGMAHSGDGLSQATAGAGADQQFRLGDRNEAHEFANTLHDGAQAGQKHRLFG